MGQDLQYLNTFVSYVESLNFNVMDLCLDHIKCIWYDVAIMTLREFFFKIFGPKYLKNDWHLGTFYTNIHNI